MFYGGSLSDCDKNIYIFNYADIKILVKLFYDPQIASKILSLVARQEGIRLPIIAATVKLTLAIIKFLSLKAKLTSPKGKLIEFFIISPFLYFINHFF